MKLIFLIIILLLGIVILCCRGERRLEFFILSIIFIPSAIPYPTSGLNAHRFFVLAFWVSLIWHNELIRTKRNAILPFLFFILISNFLIGINDDRLGAFSKFWKPTIHFITEYGLLILGIATYLTNKGWIRFRIFITNICILVCGYGIITLLLGFDPYSQGIAAVFGSESGCDFTPLGSFRTRICSFLFNSHNYGYFCSVMTILLTYFHLKSPLSQKEGISFLLVIVGLFISGSRSSLIAALIGVTILFLLGLRLKKITEYALLILLMFLPITQLSYVQKSLGSVAVIFSDDERKQNGSSIEMRQNQLEISMLYFLKSPVFGNGIDYYAEVVKSDDVVIKEQGLYGAESYIFILLIERGGIQIIIILLFCLATIFLFYYNIKKRRLESAVGMAIFLSFIFVSITTGNDGKWVFVLPFVGLFINYKNCRFKSL